MPGQLGLRTLEQATSLPFGSVGQSGRGLVASVLCQFPRGLLVVTEDYALFAEKYRLVRRLAAGGMGEVYLAHDEQQSNGSPPQVAIKRVLPAAAADPGSIKAFLDELELAPRLVHPNIVRVLGSGKAEDMYYLAMEYIKGRNVADLIGRAVQTGQPIGIACALQIIHDVASGAHYAHELAGDDGEPLGIVHRDLSPRNIMVTVEGCAKILDFGVAKARTQSNQTLPGVVKGTPSYLAPEQLRGAPPRPATDIFAMGTVLFELVTLRRLFRRATLLETMRAIMRCEVPPLSTLVPDCPPAVESLVFKALQARPSDRFASAEAMREAIAATIAELGFENARDTLGQVVGQMSDKGKAESVGLLEDETTMVEQAGSAIESVSIIAPAIKHNLPLPEHPICGRDSEMAELCALFDKGARIVTLYGPPGGGKSRLALEFARSRLNTWTSDGGAWLCELDTAENLEDVCALVATAVGSPVAVGDEMVDALGKAMAGRGPTLIMLDSVEQVTSAVTECVGQWVKAAPELCFLLTGRQRMPISGGRILEVPPLAIEPAETGSASDAMTLFLERAKANKDGFNPSQKELAIIDRIVRLLDGIPLAIELAAAHMTDLSTSQLLRALARRPDLLETGAAGRHGALGEALEWSWSLLTPIEQAVLAQSSVFHGAFDMEAADAIIDLSDHPNAPWVVDVLQALKDKSLVRSHEAADFPQEPRCRQYVSVRNFARRKLDELGGVRDAMSRHAAWFARFGAYWATDPGLEGLRRLRLDMPNLGAAHRRAMANDPLDDEHVKHALDLALSVLPVIAASGPYAAYLQLLDDMLGHPEIAHADPARRARVLVARGHVRTVKGQLKEAADDCRAAHTLAEQSGLLVVQAEALTELGMALLMAGQLDEAADVLRTALKLHGKSREPGGQGRALLRLGSLYLIRGDETRARACLEKALPRFQTVNDALYEAHCRVHLGQLEHSMGELEAAREQLEKATALLRETKAMRFEAYAALYLGAVAHEQGRMEQANTLFRRSRGLAREVGEPRWQAITMGHAALYKLDVDRPAEALKLCQRAIELSEGAGGHRHARWMRVVQVVAMACKGEIPAARKLVQGLQKEVEAADDPLLAPLTELAATIIGIEEGNRAATPLYRDKLIKKADKFFRKADRRILNGPVRVKSDSMGLFRILLGIAQRRAHPKTGS